MTAIKVPGLRKIVVLDAIIWIESDGNYSWVHFITKEKYMVAQTLKWFNDQLPGFVRIHKSSLVNPIHLLGFDRLSPREGEVILSNGTVLPISRRRLQSVADSLKKPSTGGQKGTRLYRKSSSIEFSTMP